MIMIIDKQIECPECGGEGRREYEVPVVDWRHGGYLSSEWATCEMCFGLGEITVETDEDDG